LKRRELIKTSLLAAGLTGVAPFLNFIEIRSKIGIMINLFKNSGYENEAFGNAIKYYNYNQAYQDLQTGKIDLLISSTHFLLNKNEQLSLFGSFPEHYLENGDKPAWIDQNYGHVSDLHDVNGIKAEYIGSMSSLLVRLSRVSFDELQDWKNRAPKLRIATSGLRTKWFESIGFEPHSGSVKALADKQLVNLHSGRLHVTDAFSPGLFFNAFLFLKNIEDNNKWELKQLIDGSAFKTAGTSSLEFKPFKDFCIMKDTFTKGSMPVEILYRQSQLPNEVTLNRTKAAIKNFLEEDKQYQSKVLSVFTNEFNLVYHDSLPKNLCSSIKECTDEYLNVLSQHSSHVAAELVTSYHRKES